jgi:UDP-glucuronate 4-epimerase
MKNVLVTGAAGFIGFHLCAHLKRLGKEVVGLDNFNDYYDPALKEQRATRLAEQGIDVVRADLCDREALDRLVKIHAFDGICHLAAQAGVRYSLENPFAYQKSNLEGFLSILELCRQHRIPRLVYASSSSVYGGNTKVPFSETDPVDHPVSLYAATKKANELMAHTYTHLYGIQTVGLRFFTVYGPWGRPDMAYWLFTKAILEGRAIKVFNQGDMLRDFTYIEDVVQGITAALDAEGLDPYEIFNLGNHRCEKLGHFIDVLAQTLGVEPVKEMLPMQPGDVYQTYADIDHASDKLGYQPSTPIETGLARFVDWYRNEWMPQDA